MSLADKIDDYIEMPTWLVDVFPKRVPEKNDNRYFVIEDYFRKNQKKYDEKFKDILLKLFCYYDFEISTGDGEYLNPTIEQVIHCIDACFVGEVMERDYINIFIPECDSMIIFNGDDLYMQVYHPSMELKKLIGDLAQGEGLYFYLN